MPSMASVIFRAAARAASSAAWAASRCATAAAAASDSLMRASSVAATAQSPASSRSVHLPVAARQGSGSTIAQLPSRFVKPDWAIFEADEKDLESDEALWALYERWCKFFKQERDRDEMARRFSSFKETVLCVEENKRSDLPYRLGINQFADGKLWELYGKTTMHHIIKTIPYSASPIYARAPDFLFEEDPKGPGRAGLGQAAGAAEASNLCAWMNRHDRSQDPQDP